MVADISRWVLDGCCYALVGSRLEAHGTALKWKEMVGGREGYQIGPHQFCPHLHFPSGGRHLSRGVKGSPEEPWPVMTDNGFSSEIGTGAAPVEHPGRRNTPRWTSVECEGDSLLYPRKTRML